MKINRDPLLFGLDIVKRAVATRSTLPILSHVLLDVNKDGLTLAANNLEMVIAYDVPATVKEEWAFTVPHRFLTDYVKTLPDEEITLQRDENRLELLCGRQLAHINGMEMSEFPSAPVYDGQMSELSPGTIKDMLARTLIAASTEECRPILTAIQLSTDGKEVKTTAADGFRLSEMAGTQDWSLETQAALIPATAAAEVLRISEKLPDESIRMGLSKIRAFFKIGAVRLCTVLIEGTYPNVSQIIPKGWDTQVVVPAKELSRALKVLKPFTSHTVSLDVKDDKVHLVPITTGDEYDIEGEIDANITGDKLKIGLGLSYLMDVLRVVPTENVVLEMGKPTDPVIVKPEGMENFVHCIMPAQLTGGVE